jgi:hypothetical protein
MATTFPLIGNWLVWRIGRGNKVQLGLDPYIDNKDAYMISPQLILDLKSMGYHTIRQVDRGEKTMDRKKQWLYWEENLEIWENYTRKLRTCFTNLNNEEYQLILCLNPIGDYEPILGYKTISIEGNDNLKP